MEKSASQNIAYIYQPPQNKIHALKKKRNKKEYNLLLFPVNVANKGMIQKL